MFYSEKVDKTVILYLCLKHNIPKEKSEKLLEEFLSTKHIVLKAMREAGKL